EINLKNIGELVDRIKGEPALLFSNTDPFKLARIISKSKSPAAAKPGDIAPRDIVVKAGPTQLAAGPVIGELQRVKIPAGVEGEKISIKKDTTVVKEGQVIEKPVADIISKLGIEPMEIGLTLISVWNDGTIYDKDILFIPMEKYTEDLLKAYSNAFNLSLELGYPTKYNLPVLISKAHSEAYALAMETGTLTKETLGPLLLKAQAQAAELEKKAGDLKPAEEAKEEAKDDAKDVKKEDKDEKKEDAAKKEEKISGNDEKKEKADDKKADTKPEKSDDKKSQKKKE
ncbi:MAG: 50S ribosomal protein L10, partial [Nanoarchaeota archaeon]|nr:50S ribosomal protein L10 [Nanoarchaeota archaeon]